MRKILSTIIILSIATLSVNAQRNTIRFIGFGYDNCMNVGKSIITEAAISSNLVFLFGYERTFGHHLSLGINLSIPLVSLLPVEYNSYFIDPDFNAPQSQGYGCDHYSEYHRWGISYNSKFFFTSFDEEPDGGAYIAPIIGYNSYALVMRQNFVQHYSNGSPSGDVVYINNIEKTYGVMRYGIKMGVQGTAGDLFIGYTFNSMGNRNDGLPFGLTTAVINSSNFMIGYSWGLNF